MAWIECPHGCGAKRQTVDTMSEHVEARHGDVRVLPGAQVTAPGEAEVPVELVEDIERMDAALVETSHINPDMVMRQRRDAGIQHAGKVMPEFVTAWRPDGMKVPVHARRIWELMRKGFRFRPPPREEIDRVWFHWQCPIRSCPSHTNICEIHGRPGDDSNHHLKSPDYVIIDHLHSGGKVHRQFFEMHKKELSERYKEAWLAWEAAEAEAEALGERQREEHERGLEAGAAALAAKEG